MHPEAGTPAGRRGGVPGLHIVQRRAPPGGAPAEDAEGGAGAHCVGTGGPLGAREGWAGVRRV